MNVVQLIFQFRISHKKTRERRSDEFMVVAGDIRLKRLSDIHQKKSVERIIRHQDYKVTMEGLANDVALLKVINFNTFVS